MQPLNAVLPYNIVQTTCEHNVQILLYMANLIEQLFNWWLKMFFLLTVQSLLLILTFTDIVFLCSMSFAYLLSLCATGLCEVQHVCMYELCIS